MVTIKDIPSGSESIIPYDVLVLSPGAAAVKPPLPGIDLPGIFTMKTIPDMRSVKTWIQGKSVKRAVVVGGGEKIMDN